MRRKTGRNSLLLPVPGAQGTPRARALEAAGHTGLVPERRARLVLQTDKP